MHAKVIIFTAIRRVFPAIELYKCINNEYNTPLNEFCAEYDVYFICLTTTLHGTTFIVI